MKRFGITIILAAVCCFAADAQVVVTLDYYFNHEIRKNTADQPERFHYLWEDKSNTGFSVFGDAFKNKGAVLSALDVAPTADKLKGTGIYIIVDPDTKKESPDPKYINQANVTEIAAWVKQGGVLLLMANDSANVELPHLNELAAKFGMHFNNDMQNHVVDDMHFEDGAVVTTGNAVFASAQKIFMKDVCSITLSGHAKPALVNKAGATIIAIAKYGKGMVMAIGDPWLYNEYTNGRLPATFENDKAANDIAAYLIKQAK